MAVYVSDELLSWFRWSRVQLPDQNFDCVKPTVHAPKKENHTHPVDAVFYYSDPYLNKIVYLNTDLKSYAAGSIDPKRIYQALHSLSQAIDCARTSEEWQDRYHLLSNLPYEVRGLLFVYNHDADYDKSFYDILARPTLKRAGSKPQPLKLDELPIQDGQSIHIFEPRLINYLTTVCTDAAKLHLEGSFPEKQYEFFYPELRLHKTSGLKLERPANVEMLAGPYLIIRHEAVKKYNEETGVADVRYPEGYVIYYNGPGDSAEEFVYFLDLLSGYQIIDGQHKIRVRLAHGDVGRDPKSNFKRAVVLYGQEWNFDHYKMRRLEEIEFEVIEVYRYSFSRTVIGWEE